MKNSILVTASALSDQDLLARLEALAGKERESCVELVAHIAARACRRFPLILELLASGSLTPTSVRLLGKHLTAENHQSVLAKARDRSRREIEALVAELAPRQDVTERRAKAPQSHGDTTSVGGAWAGDDN